MALLALGASGVMARAEDQQAQPMMHGPTGIRRTMSAEFLFSVSPEVIEFQHSLGYAQLLPNGDGADVAFPAMPDIWLPAPGRPLVSGQPTEPILDFRRRGAPDIYVMTPQGLAVAEINR